MESEEEQQRTGARGWGLLGAFFISAGVNHFRNPRFYEPMVPPSLAERRAAVVQVSGVAEILGGVGALLPRTRRVSGLALVALLAAIFPANLYMARTPERFRKFPGWALWARLPLQPLMMWWAWRSTRH